MKYKFWVKSSKGTDLQEWVDLDDGLVEEELRNILEDWCRDRFPMFEYTDAHVNYGFCGAEEVE